MAEASWLDVPGGAPSWLAPAFRPLLAQAAHAATSRSAVKAADKELCVAVLALAFALASIFSRAFPAAKAFSSEGRAFHEKLFKLLVAGAHVAKRGDALWKAVRLTTGLVFDHHAAAAALLLLPDSIIEPGGLFAPVESSTAVCSCLSHFPHATWPAFATCPSPLCALLRRWHASKLDNYTAVTSRVASLRKEAAAAAAVAAELEASAAAAAATAAALAAAAMASGTATPVPALSQESGAGAAATGPGGEAEPSGGALQPGGGDGSGSAPAASTGADDQPAAAPATASGGTGLSYVQYEPPALPPLRTTPGWDTAEGAAAILRGWGDADVPMSIGSLVEVHSASCPPLRAQLVAVFAPDYVAVITELEASRAQAEGRDAKEEVHHRLVVQPVRQYAVGGVDVAELTIGQDVDIFVSDFAAWLPATILGVREKRGVGLQYNIRLEDDEFYSDAAQQEWMSPYGAVRAAPTSSHYTLSHPPPFSAGAPTPAVWHALHHLASSISQDAGGD